MMRTLYSPRRVGAEGTTTYYRSRRPPVGVRVAFGTWRVMAQTGEAVGVLAGMLVFMAACFIVPLVLWG